MTKCSVTFALNVVSYKLNSVKDHTEFFFPWISARITWQSAPEHLTEWEWAWAVRAAGSNSGVSIGFERIINTILPQKNIICRENFVEITRFFFVYFSDVDFIKKIAYNSSTIRYELLIIGFIICWKKLNYGVWLN